VKTKDHLRRAQRPAYAGLFRCIGPRCEDMCCGDWEIPVDRITYQEYRRFPVEKLGSLVANFVSKSPGDVHENLYAAIHRKRDGSCPFFGTDRLCGIQNEYGPKLLSATCSLYPRALNHVQGALEGTLSLSCPEAARTVLLEEDALHRAGNLFSGEFRTDNVSGLRPHAGLEQQYLAIRSLVVAILCDRSRPLWQRLLVVASLCSRLDDLATSGELHGLQPLLDLYESTVGHGSLLELDRLEPDVAVRLEIALELSDERCREADGGQRFRNAFFDFIEGIGSMPGAGPEEEMRRFREAGRDYLAPFLDRFPFIAENYLQNYVYQHLFPFGRVGSDDFMARSFFEEAVLLIAQFSWLTTLLTGIAGLHGPKFSQAHVVATVQPFTRAVEHVPQILEDIIATVKRRNLANLEGLAKLLRM